MSIRVLTRCLLLAALAAGLCACEGPNDAEFCRTNHPDGGCAVYVACGTDCADGDVPRDPGKSDPSDAQCVFGNGGCK